MVNTPRQTATSRGADPLTGLPTETELRAIVQALRALHETLQALLDGTPAPEQGGVVSENAAVERLRGMNKAAARRWLRREGLSREVVPEGDGGRQRAARLVIWPDVLDRLREPDPAPAAPPRPRRQRQPATTFGVVPGRLDSAAVSRMRK